jgi:glycosyltransferase involved in cell wall biosynthesis
MKAPLRVVQLGPYPPPHGGVQSNLVAIRTFLRRYGAECSVINITRHRKQDGDDVYYPNSAIGVVRLLQRLRYDIVHLHVGGMLNRRVLSLGLVCTLQPGSKSVLTFHSGGYPSTPEGKATSRSSFAGFVLRRFDGLIGVNPEIMDFFKRLGASPERMRLILPHAFLPELEPASKLPQNIDSFFAGHSPMLISVSGLEPEYDVPLQIQALGELRKKFPSAGLAIFGSGSLEEEIRQRIAATPYRGDILLCGDVAHSITLRAISRADLMLRTTLYDGDAISVREGLHLGTPVIASDNGMRPPGVHLIPKSNLAALVSAMEERLASLQQNKVEHKTDESNLQAVLDFYLELAGRAKA